MLEPDRRESRIGDLGWFESVASGLALDQQAAAASRQHPTSALAKIAKTGRQVRSNDVFEAAEQGDFVATQMLERAFEFIAMAVVNITALLDPDAVVFGGGMSGQGSLLLEPVRKRAEDYGLPRGASGDGRALPGPRDPGGGPWRDLPERRTHRPSWSWTNSRTSSGNCLEPARRERSSERCWQRPFNGCRG